MRETFLQKLDNQTILLENNKKFRKILCKKKTQSRTFSRRSGIKTVLRINPQITVLYKLHNILIILQSMRYSHLYLFMLIYFHESIFIEKIWDLRSKIHECNIFHVLHSSLKLIWYDRLDPNYQSIAAHLGNYLT